MFQYIAIFILSCIGIIISSHFVINSLKRISYQLGWKEFVVAFFTASIGAVLPELFIGVRSAIGGIPELSLGNIMGQNIMLFTFSVAICTLILGEIIVKSKTVRAGTGFALLSTGLPFLLLYNGVLSRIDGVILILFFLLYVRWFFGDRDRFIKDYGEQGRVEKSSSNIFRDIGVIVGGLFIIILAAEGIIMTAGEFAVSMGVPIGVVGLTIVGAGVALPETFLSVKLALKGQSWMILGGLMGAIAISSTLVLGIVALINPIIISDFSPYYTGRFFLLFGGVTLWFFVRTSNKITKKEAYILFALYILFLFFEFIV